MPAIQRISDRRTLADLVALDRDDRPVLIVAVDSMVADPIVHASYLEVLKAIRRDIPFAMIVNPETITIYRKDRTRSLEPVATVPTREVLTSYDPDPRPWEGTVSKLYLAGRTEAWLRDLMWHWKFPTPPAVEILAALGLAGRLEDGRSRREVRLACLPVRRDELPAELRDWPESGDGFHPVGPAPIRPADHA